MKADEGPAGPAFYLNGIVLAMLLPLDHELKNNRGKSGWMGIASGLGLAFVGGCSGLWAVLIFGALLATLGIAVYKIEGDGSAGGQGRGA